VSRKAELEVDELLFPLLFLFICLLCCERWVQHRFAFVIISCRILTVSRKAELEVDELLDRHQPTSPHHLPTFSAVVHGYPEILELLLEAGMDPEGAACTEHIEVVDTSPLIPIITQTPFA